MRKIKAIICAALSVCIMSLPLASTVVLNAGAEDVQSLRNQLEELEAQNKEYQEILDQTQSDIASKEKYGETLMKKIQVLDEKIILTRESIAELNTNISAKQDEIDKGNQDIEAQLAALSERLRVIYMAGSASDLELVLGAKDFSDFIDKVSLVKTLSNYDKELIDGINSKLVIINKQKEALEADKAELEEQEQALNSDLEELSQLAEENEEVLKELAEKSEAAQAALDNNSTEKSEIEAQIAQYFAEQEAARKAAQQQANSSSQSSGGSSGSSSQGSSSSQNGSQSDDDYVPPAQPDVPSSSGYVWPCPGFYYRSSEWNEDRTTYNHGAIDIAGYGIHGAAVVAADSGTVSYTNTSCIHDWGKYASCGCGGGYGNYVWINHGNGKETIYAHLCRVAVSPGQYVTKGQVIGYVGSTGYSTGDHLHFECRYNGVKYNPMTEF